jgi:hypothetical protein
MMILKTILIYVLSILSFILVPSINSEGSKSKLLIILVEDQLSAFFLIIYPPDVNLVEIRIPKYFFFFS